MSARLIDRSWLDAPPARVLIAVLEAAGIDFRFVGGAVRDAVLGRTAADVDLATPALPDVIAGVVAGAGLKSIPTGLAHGTLTVLVDRRHFEITTLRRDVETDGRHARVAFTDDWRADAARRDFTMNALYADRDGAVTDFFGGVSDALDGRVRFIGDPERRIGEDALRILRFFRFHAWLGRGAFDPEGLAACARLAPMIDRLSGERVRDESLKLLAAPAPTEGWTAMIAAGIMAHVIPFADDVSGLSRLIDAETGLGLQAAPLRRLAALIGPASAERVAWLKDRLKLSNRDAEYLSSLDGAAVATTAISQGAFGRAAYGRDPAWVRDAAVLAHSRTGRPDREALAAFDRFIVTWRQPRLRVTGADLAGRGVAPGPEMGRLLSQLEDWWVAADFPPGRDACLAALDGLIELGG